MPCLLSNQRKTFENTKINFHLKQKLLKNSEMVSNGMVAHYLNLQASETAKDVHDGPSKIDLKSFQIEHKVCK